MSTPFAQPPQQTPQSIFAAAPTIQPPTFGSAPSHQSPFGPAPQQAVSNVFGNSTPFEAPAQQQSQNQPSQLSDSVYTKMENLTKQQLDAFQADRFDLGNIPTCPPPREMCS
jgi:nucleoporin-like protein 2